MFFFSSGERVPRRDHADLRPADVDAVAVACGLVALELETDEHALRVRLAARRAPPCRRSRRPCRRVTTKPIPASNGSTWSSNSSPAKTSPASIRSMSSASSPSGSKPERLAGLHAPRPRPRRRPSGGRRARSRARRSSRCARRRSGSPAGRRCARSRSGTTRARRTVSASARSRRSASGSRATRGPWTPTLWRSSVDALTHTLSPSFSACSRSQTPSYSAPPIAAEVVRRDPEDGAVVEHAARLVAHRRVDDLAVRELADVARQRRAAAAPRRRARGSPTCAAATGP